MGEEGPDMACRWGKATKTKNGMKGKGRVVARKKKMKRGKEELSPERKKRKGGEWGCHGKKREGGEREDCE
jgi:hypothetical protein